MQFANKAMSTSFINSKRYANEFKSSKTSYLQAHFMWAPINSLPGMDMQTQMHTHAVDERNLLVSSN